jgi:hypothetical protein
MELILLLKGCVKREMWATARSGADSGAADAAAQLWLLLILLPIALTHPPQHLQLLPVAWMPVMRAYDLLHAALAPAGAVLADDSLTDDDDG